MTTDLERLYIKRRLDGLLLAPARTYPDARHPLGVPCKMGTPYNAKGDSWSLGRHTGVDFPCAIGSLAVSLSWGRVLWAGQFGGWSRNGTYGKHVVIRTGDGEHDYAECHLDSIHVKVGQKVRPGMILGLTGDTGNTHGAHMHLEARPAGGGFGTDVRPILVRGRS